MAGRESSKYTYFDKTKLEIKPTSRLVNILYGPFIKHNFLVHCGIILEKENGKFAAKERFWHIFPTGGRYSIIGDAIAFLFWYIFLLYPFVAIAVGCFCRNQVNIINAVILCIIMMYHLMTVFQITKNIKKFKRMWYISLIELKTYLGLQNVIYQVGVSDVDSLELIPCDKRKKITQKLCQHPDARVILMLCTRSFWSGCFLEPVVCLSLGAFSCLISALVQLETMNGLP
ncbi:uncharacterized protein LOC126818974 [Patella vulgata]|uniref:uncharacterized protein LOC126818974 n=1 Tax=Patella vulgata TaxID=6465 RepID=UPI00217F28F7|nr:uncharacterized protein LOC126818974 [Patella vulgata]XP_050402658.1 uncharacterized protein LOC126818974 [Patella vulgata]XP_050402659.1 uncharacterized protein LOC126818974 [Patella vulgata]XP_050402660.1 uncharacterized protein LOC126818974 [Patella vulgata]XP_050402661.1 uncharacterized protein LOC126818974 [Patella vulgata]XP_050402662.1 uncharacterized protein LOC126818974 [Patella vulgata]XP_050402663.1 uncharacterized protein LOC126818974 [Patella vulgata]XP_050402664.1 uncharacte